MLFRFTFALAFALISGPKTGRQRVLGYRLPRTVNMDARFPVRLTIAVIVAIEIEMEGKIYDNIDAAARIINKLHPLVFVAITMRRSMWGRSVFVPAARPRTNRKALA
jgi:hypothetical protein